MARACRARSYELDPVAAAFNIGALIRWLDFNDTWLAAEWGHPSDNLGAILAVADYLEPERRRRSPMRDVLTAMIKAHEIQGVLALENCFNRVGPRSRPARPHRLDRRRHRAARRHARADHQRALARLARRRRAAHLPPRAEHRLAQIVGRRRRDRARRAARAHRAARRDGLPRRALAPRRGAFRTCSSAASPCTLAPPARQLRDGARAVQDLLPRRVPRADRRRSRDHAASARARPPRRDRAHRDHDAGIRDAHHSTRPARSRTPPTAITASNT